MTIDELDPVKNKLENKQIQKFLSYFDETFIYEKKPKGPDYLIIDNFADILGFETNDLVVARSESENAAKLVCD